MPEVDNSTGSLFLQCFFQRELNQMDTVVDTNKGKKRFSKSSPKKSPAKKNESEQNNKTATEEERVNQTSERQEDKDIIFNEMSVNPDPKEGIDTLEEKAEVNC